MSATAASRRSPGCGWTGVGSTCACSPTSQRASSSSGTAYRPGASYANIAIFSSFCSAPESTVSSDSTKYETRTAQRNGSRPRMLTTTAGDLELRIPKLRAGSSFPSLRNAGPTDEDLQQVQSAQAFHPSPDC